MEDKIVQIKKIKEFLDQGLINQIEFDELKKEIIGSSNATPTIKNIIDENITDSNAEKLKATALTSVMDGSIKSKEDAKSNVSASDGINENTVNANSTQNNNDSVKINSTTAKKDSNKTLFFLFISILILIVGAVFYSQSTNKSSEAKIGVDSTKLDSNRTNVNEWLKKATGYDFKLDNSRISFDIKNYSLYDTSIKLNVSGSEENGVKNPILSYYNSYIVIEFENGWKHHIYLTNNLVINSIHYGSHGESVLYNLNTKSSNILDYEVTNINGKEAVIMSSGHDSVGGFVNNTGKLNLETLEVNWDDVNNQTNQNSQNNSNVSFIAPETVYVVGGTFNMGSEKEAKLVHQVTVNGFYMSKYDITVAEYKFFCNNTQRSMPEAPWWGWVDNQPMVDVSYNNATAYCSWLSHKTGKVYRLPTEAEWEYAARGGNQTKGYTYAGSNDLNDVGWFDKKSDSTGVRPVGEKKPNELGLYDMSGNVWQWCSDWFDEGYYLISSSSNPKGPASGKCHVTRGGCYTEPPSSCSVFFRKCAGSAYDCLGFRVVSSK